MADINRFMKRITAVWPDAECPGWMVCYLECCHLTYQPKGNKNKSCHCGDCVLNNQKHMAELAKFAPKEIVTDAVEPF